MKKAIHFEFLVALAASWFVTSLAWIIPAYKFTRTEYPETVMDFLGFVIKMAALTGAIAFPLCLVLFYPIFLVFPRHALIWRPRWAGLFCALLGPLLCHTGLVVSNGPFDVPLSSELKIFYHYLAAVGLGFGYSLATLVDYFNRNAL